MIKLSRVEEMSSLKNTIVDLSDAQTTNEDLIKDFDDKLEKAKHQISELLSEKHSLEGSLKNKFEETKVLKTMNNNLQEKVELSKEKSKENLKRKKFIILNPKQIT